MWCPETIGLTTFWSPLIMYCTACLKYGRSFTTLGTYRVTLQGVFFSVITFQYFGRHMEQGNDWFNKFEVTWRVFLLASLAWRLSISHIFGLSHKLIHPPSCHFCLFYPIPFFLFPFSLLLIYLFSFFSSHLHDLRMKERLAIMCAVATDPRMGGTGLLLGHGVYWVVQG